ncbi:MAG: hypothetical protein VXW65_07185 [Pseudomonadota bacterium]|nr:hypothetical protein [Pseudomonadota bacterium]
MTTALEMLQRRYESSMAHMLQKSNEFRLSVQDFNCPAGFDPTAIADFLDVHAPTVEPSEFINIAHENVAISGSGLQLASMGVRENMLLNVSCYDRPDGLIRRWLLAKSHQMIAKDGTYGVPAEYALVLSLRSAPDKGMFEDYLDLRPIVKVVSVGFSHEAEGGLIMLNVGFVQIDPFISHEALLGYGIGSGRQGVGV